VERLTALYSLLVEIVELLDSSLEGSAEPLTSKGSWDSSSPRSGEVGD